MDLKFLKCERCGNIVEVLKDSGVPIVCCGQNMTELIPGTSDGAHEKHVPVITRLCKGTYRVTIGAEPHPVEAAHHIDFIYLKTERGGQLRYLGPLRPAQADFIDCNDPIVGVYAHCNLHGLWYADVQSCKDSSCARKKPGKLMAALTMLFPFLACT